MIAVSTWETREWLTDNITWREKFHPRSLLNMIVDNQSIAQLRAFTVVNGAMDSLKVN